MEYRKILIENIQNGVYGELPPRNKKTNLMISPHLISKVGKQLPKNSLPDPNTFLLVFMGSIVFSIVSLLLFIFFFC